MASEPTAVAQRPPDQVGYRFIVCDLATGRRWGTLPLAPQGEVVRGLLGVETLGYEVPVFDPAMPTTWADVTTPGRTMVVVERLPDQTLLQGYAVLGRTRGSSGVRLDTATLEAFLDRRYVGDHLWYHQDSATVIFTGLIADANVQGVAFTVDAASSVKLDRAYADADSQTVLAALAELLSAEDGPEAVVDVAWADTDRTTVVKTLRVAPRIGAADPDGRVTFRSPGPVTAYDEVHDFTGERGATSVRAGTEGLLSDPETAGALLALGFPRWEARTEHDNVISTGQLQSLARRDLRRMRNGSLAYSFTVDTTQGGPQPRTDFDVGDDTALSVRPWPVHPAGLEVVARCSSWRLDTSSGVLTPVLVSEAEAEDDG